MAGRMNEIAVTRIGQAIAADSCESLLWCLNHGENLHYRDKRKNTYLHYACTMYRPKVLYLLLTTDLNIDASNKSGNTPLHITAVCNQSCLVPHLMMSGADPYIRNNEGKYASEIETNNGTWRSAFQTYEPGVFMAVERGDGEKLLNLMHKWCKMDVEKNDRTVRQHAASRGFHDLVALIDKHKYTLACIHGVLEQDFDKFEKGATKTACDINWLNKGCGHRHIIQYAIEWNNYEMVKLLCERGAYINMSISLNNYIKAPLFYSVIGNHSVGRRVMQVVIESGVDINSKDERGRNPLMFALDKAPAAHLQFLVDFLLSNGIHIADRDDTGASARNVAMLNGDQRTVQAIDKLLIRLFRASDVDRLWRLAEDGYDDFLFEYLWKDSFVYAAGNDTDDVARFLSAFPQLQSDAHHLHSMLEKRESPSDVRDFIDASSHRDHLLVAKDGAGRTPLTKAVMTGDLPLVDCLLSYADCASSLNDKKDHLNRTCLHYAYAIGQSEDSELVRTLIGFRAAGDIMDVFGRTPESYVGGRARVQLLDDLKRKHGLQMEMHLLKRYKEMVKIITSTRPSPVRYKKFLKSSRNLWYPISAMAKALNPRGIPLAKGYRDLLFIAIEQKQVEIGKKLVYLGSDCDRSEWVVIGDGDDRYQKLMTPTEYARHHELPDLALYIGRRKLSGSHRTALFHRAITQLNDSRGLQ